MEVLDIVLRLVGAFYALGAIVAIRAMAMSELLDRAIDAITMANEQPKRVGRRWLMGAGMAVSGTSGVALALMSFWALPLFVAGTVLNIAWLFWAATAFPPEDEDDAQGRRSTTNAAIGYGVITVVVAWVAGRGMLGEPFDPLHGAIIAIAAVSYCVYLLRGLLMTPARSFAADPYDSPKPKRIRIVLDSEEMVLQDAETGRGLSVFGTLPEDLGYRFEEWHDRWFAWLDLDEPGQPARFPSPEDEKQHRAELAAMIEEMEAIFGKGNVEGPY